MNFLGFSPGRCARLAKPSTISLSSENAANSFLKERPDACPRFLSRPQFEQTAFVQKPIICFTTETKAEIGECGTIITVVRNLSFVDSGDELSSGDCVLAFFPA
jgi:hypothetical protein